MTPTPIRPDWDALAGAILHRLRCDVARKSPDPDRALGLAEAFPDAATGPLNLLAVAHLPPDVADGIRAEGGDPAATLVTGESRPPVHLPVPWLLMAVRLAASFGSAERLASAFSPSAVTALRLPEVTDGDALSLVIWRAALPKGRSTKAHPSTLTHGADDILLLRPEGTDGQLARNAAARLAEAVRLSLATDRPILILLPAAIRLPESLLRLLPEPVDLRPLDAEMLRAALRRSHSATGRIDEASVAAAMPASEALAKLPSEAITTAFRAPTAAAAVRKLAAIVDATPAEPPGTKITGTGAAAEAARRIAADLRDWRDGKVAWDEATRSMLLSGPPGTGKSWLARSVAAEAGVPLVEGSFAAWQALGHLGDMLGGMRATFETARRTGPCVVFIDELDAVGSRSGKDDHGATYRRQVVNGFLLEIDAALAHGGIVVLGACNDPSVIDPAVIRAGRMDRRIEMPMPDADRLMLVLRRHLGDEMPAPALQDFAKRALGCSLADMDAAIRELRSRHRRDGEPVTLEALARELGIVANPALDWRAAVHECGHAVVATALGQSTVTRMAIYIDGGETMRRGVPAAGTISDYDHELAVVLAGRAAEALVFGTPGGGSGGGARSDLAVATVIALGVHCQLGLGWSGSVWSRDAGELVAREPGLFTAIRKHLEAAERQASALLTERRELLEDMARALVAERQLEGEKLNLWLRRVPPAHAGAAAVDEEVAPEPASGGALEAEG
ncbi:AAA family ATPase [Frigidibacter sp. MR17.14]|uniref:AAA family ATPase n=1 Tax=Frigidibacter sp. MR17.14 TaxID=3126509 RepID=UPI0030130D69